MGVRAGVALELIDVRAVLAKDEREAKLMTTSLNPVSTRTVLVLFCFYFLNIEIILGGKW